MNIEGFRAAADRPNVIMVVDVKSAQVKARNNHVLTGRSRGFERGFLRTRSAMRRRTRRTTGSCRRSRTAALATTVAT